MITGLLILATEAAEEGGFGLDLNIFETNLFNLAILVGLLVYFGRKPFLKILSDRRTQIAEMIQEAEGRQAKTASALADQQEKLAQAKAQAEKIRQEAQVQAERVKNQILAQAEADIERMQETAARDMSSQQDRVIEELKQRIAALAIERVTGDLGSRLDEDKQRRIIDRSIAQLGG